MKLKIMTVYGVVEFMVFETDYNFFYNQIVIGAEQIFGRVKVSND